MEHHVLLTVQRYNPDTDQWQEVSPLSSSRSNVCAVAHGNYLYAIGGTSARFEYLSIVERFDPRRNAWENLPSLLTGRSFASGTAVKGKVFVFGGLRPFFRDGDPCEVYDPETNIWSAFLVMLHLEAMQVLRILLMGNYLLMVFLEMSYKEEEGSFSCTMLRKMNGNPFQNMCFILAGMKLLLYEFQEMSLLIAGKFQIDTWRG